MQAEDKLFHAYLISSGTEQEREALARELAQTMVCSSTEKRPCGECRHCRKALSGIHPDILYVERETDDKGVQRREITVGQARKMAADAWIRPNEADRKVYIIRDAQTLNLNAQNALLKLLEEPPAGACFILCADNAASLLDTVRSRCVERMLHVGAGAEESGENAEAIDAYLHIAAKQDLPALLRLTADWEKLDTEALRTRIDELYARLSEALCLRADAQGLSREQLGRLLALADRAREYLRANVGGKHVLGLLSAETIELRNIRNEE